MEIERIDKEVKETMTSIFGAMSEKFYVVISNRKMLSELYRLMSVDSYRVDSITALNDTKSFEEFKKELLKGSDNKPKGLNFGDNE